MSSYLLYRICKPKSQTEGKFQSKAVQNLHHLQARSDTKVSAASATFTPIPTFLLQSKMILCNFSSIKVISQYTKVKLVLLSCNFIYVVSSTNLPVLAISNFKASCVQKHTWKQGLFDEPATVER